MATLRHPIAQQEIVGAILSHGKKSANFIQARSPNRHGGSQRKLHPFQHVGNQHAGTHFDGHGGGFDARPQPALRGNAPVQAGHCADGCIGKGRDHVAHVVGVNPDIAIANDHQVILGSIGHSLQRQNLCIRHGRLTAGKKLDRHIGKSCGDSPGCEQPGIVRLSCTEENFVGGIHLLKKSREVRIQVRFCPVQRFQQADGRLEDHRSTILPAVSKPADCQQR